MLAFHAFGADRGILRVCADPNNLPFSNRAGEGFENRIAELIAGDLGTKLEFVWWAERKNFIERSINAGACDAIMGVPASLEIVETTQPYYHSSYVFVTRRGAPKHIASLADPSLQSMRIGIHVIDGDYAPPAQLLAREGLSANLIGFSLYGKENEANPPARLLEAVSRGDVDVAIAWGPLAGYFARNQPLEITPVAPRSFLTIPFTYQIAMAARKGDSALRDKLNQSLNRQCVAIQALLTDYGIPLVSGGTPPCVAASSH